MKEVHVGRPIIVGETTIIPLERVRVSHSTEKGGLSAYISKEPIGIVISTPQGKWAVDICGGQVTLEAYIQEIPGLQQVLDSL